MKFRARLFKYPGPGGWTFVVVPDRHAPPVTHGWGRTPVQACVDGQWRDTSVWRDRTHGTLLAVAKAVRRGKGEGDTVEVEIRPREDGPMPGRTAAARETRAPRPSTRGKAPRGARR